jgi:hypothetical protein
MARPLPGITFQAVPPDLGEKLPRMDVAAFVGFAASGPLHTPVVVEDEVHFRRIFGEDLALAWDEAAGMLHHAYLGPAVRAFFKNGGRRCWVVRVASDEARTNQFLLPGLMRLDPTGFLRPASVQARSEGAWSDSVRTGTALVAAPLRLVRFAREGDELEIELSRISRQTLRQGDLLRFAFPKAVLYLVVETVAAEGHVWKVHGQEHWFRREPAVDALPSDLDVWLRRPEGRRRRLRYARWQAPGAPGGEHRVFVPRSAGPVGPGALLELETANYPTLLLSVMESRAATPEEVERLSLGAGPWTALAGRDPLGPATRRVGRALSWAVAEAGVIVERLTFELWVEDGEAQPYRLGGLGFGPGHPRFLGDLPTDARLFGSRESGVRARPDGPARGEQLWPDVVEPRFPLAGEEPGELYLPLGMPWQSRREWFAGPQPVPGSAEVRNGLGAFDPAVFLDPDLADMSSDALGSAISQKHDVMGRPLSGLQALWPVEEATLVALPDAIHPPWAEDVADVILPPAAPFLNLGTGGLSWTAVTTATGYVVQVAGDPAFEGPLRSVVVTGTSMAVPTEGGCPETRYYRVRAVRQDQQGPWSNTRRLLLDASDFEVCSPEAVVEAPTLAEPGALGEHRFALTWSVGTPGATYTAEEAADPDFFGARVLYAGADRNITLVRTGEKPTYYRVRAEKDGRVSPWSRSVWLLEQDPRRAVVLQPHLADPEDQLRLHGAALRFAAARADLLAVLTLPAPYREQDAVTYTRSLVTRVGGAEERALSYGALYHPWVWLQEGTGPALLVPPDGPILGRMAWRALERGAWVAPANDDLAGVVALAPALTGEAWNLFTESQINLVQRDPRGFVALSADTLSPDESLRLINVRRLLILLRRLALREGASLVFEPNDESFRRLVQRRFEGMLGQLYVRGAFAGNTAEEGFRVVTGASVNPRQSVDEGRFVVELRVAPSKPLTFLTVRLIQARGAGPAFQEV